MAIMPECLEAINDKEVEKCQKKFTAILKAAGEPKQITVGTPGGIEDIDAWWINEYKFWWGYTKTKTLHR